MCRNLNDKIIAGVCSGLAESINCDAAIVRLIFLCAFLFFGVGPLLYLILWILMKPEGGA